MTIQPTTTQSSSTKTKHGRVSLPLVAGEWVEVRGADEILATLDDTGRLDGMPFMPEMLQLCGRRLRVFKRAHKTCDTLYQSGSRSLQGTVHLDESRCDGSAHGGCQAQCMLFWKEAWLKPVRDLDAPVGEYERALHDAPQPPTTKGCTLRQLQLATQGPSEQQPAPRYSCQATELLHATRPLSGWDMRQYLQDYRSGNTDVATLLRGMMYRLSAYAIRRTAWLGQYIPAGAQLSEAIERGYDHLQTQMHSGVPYPRRTGTIPKGQRTPQGDDISAFRPGTLVRVKRYDEILATLDSDNKNRGLYFDAENVPYCGQDLRVRALVERIIDERTGYMLHFKTPSIILEGAYCRGTYSDKRMFCPRAVYPYWRPAWLVPLQESAIQATDADGAPPHPSAA